MKSSAHFLLIMLLCLKAAQSQIGYSNDKLLRTTLENQDQLSWFSSIQDKIDIWKEPLEIGDFMDFQISKDSYEDITHYLNSAGLEYSILSDDVGKLVDEHRSKVQKLDVSPFTFDGYNYTYYLPYDDIMKWMDALVENCTERHLCEKFNVGKSYENRDMYGIKIFRGGDAKRGIWIDGGIHAREWISPATVLFMADSLISLYGVDSNITRLVNHYDWYILPVVNPDGYIYTWYSNETRLWRKTRQPSSNTTCVGVDANRNFDFHWNTIGTSSDPCSNIYPGPSAFSEPEARNVANFVQQKPAGTFDIFITVHSYSQLFLAPWGYKSDPTPDYPELERAARLATDVLKSFFGTVYRVGRSATILYPSSGTSRDWAKGVPNITYVYTIELRDNGTYGFLLPEDQIFETAFETWEGIKAMTLDLMRILN